LKLRLHYQQQRGDAPDEPNALDRLVGAIDSAFDALGNAVDDQAVKSDARAAGQALSDALAATLAEAGGAAKKALNKPQD